MPVLTLRLQWQTVIAVLLLAITIFLLSGSSAHAQAVDETSSSEEVDQASQVESNQFVPVNYNFTVEECNNHTLLIRKSIQLYDRADEGVSLSEAQIIYAETNIAKDIEASDLIYPDEKINIDASLVSSYAEKATKLTESQIAAWQNYAVHANFDLDDISADNVAVTEDGDVAQVDEDSGELIDTAEPTVDDTSEDENADEDSASAGWWLLGGGAIVGLWYLLWQRGGEEE